MHITDDSQEVNKSRTKNRIAKGKHTPRSVLVPVVKNHGKQSNQKLGGVEKEYSAYPMNKDDIIFVMTVTICDLKKYIGRVVTRTLGKQMKIVLTTEILHHFSDRTRRNITD